MSSLQHIVENQSGMKIRNIRSNNGKEYINKNFNKFLNETKIHHLLNVAYTHQQNEVSEKI